MNFYTETAATMPPGIPNSWIENFEVAIPERLLLIDLSEIKRFLLTLEFELETLSEETSENTTREHQLFLKEVCSKNKGTVLYKCRLGFEICTHQDNSKPCLYTLARFSSLVNPKLGASKELDYEEFYATISFNNNAKISSEIQDHILILNSLANQTTLLADDFAYAKLLRKFSRRINQLRKWAESKSTSTCLCSAKAQYSTNFPAAN